VPLFALRRRAHTSRSRFRLGNPRAPSSADLGSFRLRVTRSRHCARSTSAYRHRACSVVSSPNQPTCPSFRAFFQRFRSAFRPCCSACAVQPDHPASRSRSRVFNFRFARTDDSRHPFARRRRGSRRPPLARRFAPLFAARTRTARAARIRTTFTEHTRSACAAFVHPAQPASAPLSRHGHPPLADDIPTTFMAWVPTARDIHLLTRVKKCHRLRGCCFGFAPLSRRAASAGSPWFEAGCFRNFPSRFAASEAPHSKRAAFAAHPA
jgi:hypothetical protein